MGTFTKRNSNTSAANAKREVLADEFSVEIYRLVMDEMQYDILSQNLPLNLYQIAMKLNELGFTTRTGKRWSQNTVKNVLKRAVTSGLLETTDPERNEYQ